MNLQSIVLVILLAGAFLLAVRKGKHTSCCGDCAHCSGGQGCTRDEKEKNAGT